MNNPLAKKADPSQAPANTVTAADPNRTVTHAPDVAASSNLPKLPGYELLGTLGKGGMGVVYHARQVKLNRPVALKMVLGDAQADSKEIIRFLAEAEAVAAIDHPNVVRVYDYGESEGRPYLALEYLAGGSLADKLKSGRLKIAAAALVVEKIARGVAAAHELGIVHRDLKPGNVLLDAAGEPKVADFGLAKRGFGAELTQTQAVMGTPAYMSPEQAEGKTKFVGPPADVWALGVILYECLTGQRPFRAQTTEELLAKLIHADPAPLRPRVPKLPRDMELICFKCLSKNPADRYAAASEVAEDLRRFSAGEPVSVKPAGAVESAVKWAKRKPTLAAAVLLGVLAILLGSLTAVAGWGWRTAETARDAEESQKLLAEQARETAEMAQKAEAKQREAAEIAQHNEGVQRQAAEKARGELFVESEKLAVVEYGRTIQIAYESWRDNNVGATLALLEKTRPDIRGWEWHYVHRLAHLDLLTLKGHAAWVSSASFSPNGTQIVTGGGTLPGAGDSTARLWDAKTGAELLCLDGHKERLFSASFSRDGTKIVTTSYDKTAKVWDAKTGDELFTLKGHMSRVVSASFSVDGTRLVTISDDHIAKVWNAKGGTALFDLKGHTGPLYSVSFSGDGTRITTASHDNTLKVWNAKTGAEILTQKGPPGQVRCGSFSLDGTRIVTGNGDGSVRVWETKTGADLLLLKGHARAVTSASFDPDGTCIVTTSEDQTARVWDAKTGVELRTLRGHTSIVQAASFSLDGTRIVTASFDQTAKVWDVKAGDEPLTLEVERVGQERMNVCPASFNSGSTRIVTGSSDGPAKVWDARNGVNLLILPHKSVNSASFSSDGKRIVTGGSDGAVKVWDAEVGDELFMLKGHTDRIVSASFAPNGARIVTAGGFDQSAKVWDAKTRAELVTLKGHTNNVSSVSFNPAGTRIVTASSDSTAKVWDAQTGTEILTLRGHSNEVHSALFSRDGARIVTASVDNTAKVWDAKTGAELLTLKGHTFYVVSAAFSPDGTRIVTASIDNTTKLWDAKSGAEFLTLKGHTGRGVVSALFSPDGTRIITSDGATAKVWDSRPVNTAYLSPEKEKTGAPLLVKAEELDKFAGHAGLIHNVAVSADGKTAVSVGSDRTGIVWDIETGKLRHRLVGSPDQLYAVAIAPDGKLAMTGGQDYASPKDKNDLKVRAWDTQSGKQIQALVGHSAVVSRFATMQKGRLFVSSSWDHTVRRWNPIDGGESELLFRSDQPISALAIDTASDRIAIGNPQGSIAVFKAGDAKPIWIAALPVAVHNVAWVSDSTIAVAGDGKVPALVDITTKRRIMFVGHTRNAQAIDAIPGGKHLVTGSDDGTVRVWNVSDGSELGRFNPGCGMIRAVRVLPDGQRVLCTGSDGTLRLWRLPLPKTGS